MLVFSRDQLAADMHVARAVCPDAFGAQEWAWFMEQTDSGQEASLPPWIPAASRPALASLAAACPWLTGALVAAGDAAAAWLSTAEPEAAPAPPGIQELPPFQQLLLLKALRPDRLMRGATRLVSGLLGMDVAATPACSLASLLQQPQQHPPEAVLFITGPGADPTQELRAFAGASVGFQHYQEVAMGQGTTEVALQKLHSAAQAGEWLCLKNVHLVSGWLPALDKAVHFLDGAAPGFRLFLTAEPHPGVPPTLLENSLKVAFEAPPGIKRSMRRAYEGWSASFLAAGGVKQAQLLFSLAWLHAVMAERQAYVPEVGCCVCMRGVAPVKATATMLGLDQAIRL